MLKLGESYRELYTGVSSIPVRYFTMALLKRQTDVVRLESIPK